MLLLQESRPPQIGLHKVSEMAKKGISHIYVCYKINLALVPLHTWSIDYSHK